MIRGARGAVRDARDSEVRGQAGDDLRGAGAVSCRLREQQATLAAMRQQVTRDLDEAKARGRDVAVRFRDGVRSTYGLKAEKLAEFGLRPRRKRRPS